MTGELCSLKMAQKSEPEYMELTKDSEETTDKEAEAHIYELDVPKPPEEASLKAKDKKKEEGDHSSAVEYHYVRNDHSRTSQTHLSAKIASLEKEGGLSKLGKEARLHKRKRQIIFSYPRRKWTSLKCIAIIVLFILTVLNTVMATAALAIGGMLYARTANNSASEEGFPMR